MAKKRRKSKPRRKAYVTNPAPRKSRRRRRAAVPRVKARRRRSYRKNPESIVDTLIFAGSAAAGAVIGNKVSKFIPGSNLIKNLALFGAGVGLAYFGRRKNYLMGAGVGMATVSGFNLLTNQFPMLSGEDLTQDEQQEAIAAISALSGEDDENSFMGEDGEYSLDAPLSSEFGAPLSSEFGAPLSSEFGDMNETLM